MTVVDLQAVVAALQALDTYITAKTARIKDAAVDIKYLEPMPPA